MALVFDGVRNLCMFKPTLSCAEERTVPCHEISQQIPNEQVQIDSVNLYQSIRLTSRVQPAALLREYRI
jgi:hypothetical protein